MVKMQSSPPDKTLQPNSPASHCHHFTSDPSTLPQISPSVHLDTAATCLGSGRSSRLARYPFFFLNCCTFIIQTHSRLLSITCVDKQNYSLFFFIFICFILSDSGAFMQLNVIEHYLVTKVPVKLYVELSEVFDFGIVDWLFNGMPQRVMKVELDCVC